MPKNTHKKKVNPKSEISKGMYEVVPIHLRAKRNARSKHRDHAKLNPYKKPPPGKNDSEEPEEGEK